MGFFKKLWTSLIYAKFYTKRRKAMKKAEDNCKRFRKKYWIKTAYEMLEEK